MFLAQQQLAQAVRRMLKGKGVRVATAFIGRDYKDELQEVVRNGGFVICDVSMGVTHAGSLRDIRDVAPDQVAKVLGLHAKMIIDDNSALISSANLSGNALGVAHRPARLVEAGVLVGKESAEYKDCITWFSGLLEESMPVTDADLAKLERDNHACSPTEGAATDLFAALISNPESFGNTKFALTFESNSKEEVESAFEEVNSQLHGRGIAGISKIHAFSNWGKRFLWWPERFMAVHWGNRGGIYVNEYQKLILASNDVLFVRPIRENKDALKAFKSELERNGVIYDWIKGQLESGQLLSASDFSNLLNCLTHPAPPRSARSR